MYEFYSRYLFVDVFPTCLAPRKRLWKIKIKQQISGCFRTDSGADDFAKLHSIAETAVKNGNSMRLNLHVTNAILVAVQP